MQNIESQFCWMATDRCSPGLKTDLKFRWLIALPWPPVCFCPLWPLKQKQLTVRPTVCLRWKAFLTLPSSGRKDALLLGDAACSPNFQPRFHVSGMYFVKVLEPKAPNWLSRGYIWYSKRTNKWTSARLSSVLCSCRQMVRLRGEFQSVWLTYYMTLLVSWTIFHTLFIL